MAPIEPRMEEAIGHDALKVWLDFWELTGRMRVDIIRRTGTGGDPAKMIPQAMSETVIRAAQAILVGSESDPVQDRAGEIPTSQLKLEFIDCVHRTDRLRINGFEHEIDSVEERDMGNFAIWIVRAHRIE